MMHTHSFHSSNVCFISSLVNYSNFPLESLIGLLIRTNGLTWCSRGLGLVVNPGKKKTLRTMTTVLGKQFIPVGQQRLFCWHSELPSAQNVLPTQIGSIHLWHRCFCHLSIISKSKQMPLRPILFQDLSGHFTLALHCNRCAGLNCLVTSHSKHRAAFTPPDLTAKLWRMLSSMEEE